MEFKIQHLLPLEKKKKKTSEIQENKDLAPEYQSLAIKYIKGSLIVILDKA